jgi:hypothetical protein
VGVAVATINGDSTVKIKCLFIQRKERYEGQYAPNLAVAVDEYADEENPDFYVEQKKSALAELSDSIVGYTEVVLTVDMEFIRKRCLTPPEVSTTLEGNS